MGKTVRRTGPHPPVKPREKARSRPGGLVDPEARAAMGALCTPPSDQILLDSGYRLSLIKSN